MLEWAGLLKPLGCISNASHAILGSQVACQVFWTGSHAASTRPGSRSGHQVSVATSNLSVCVHVHAAYSVHLLSLSESDSHIDCIVRSVAVRYIVFHH